MSQASKLKIWLAAARLRTLPLSVAGIITGNALALHQVDFSWLVFVGALMTAISYQVLSNFANDYGDGVKGTDNAHRVGPQRILQQKLLTAPSLFRGIIITAISSFILSLGLIYFSFGIENLKWMGLFLFFSLGAIWAAYNYTIGEKAYGYYALGDVFVFVFFGAIAVGGAYFLQTHSLRFEVFLYAIALGGLSVGVLNLNNMRDRENDQNVNKQTIATLLGHNKSKIYQFVLVMGSLVAIGTAIVFNQTYEWTAFLPLLAAIPLSIQLNGMVKTQQPHAFDSFLKPLALTTFLLSLLIFVSKWLEM